MRRYRSVLLLPILAVLAVGCGGESSPTEPQVNAQNGFLAERAGSAAAAVELQDTSATITWDPGSKAWLMSATGTTGFAKKLTGDNPVSLRLSIPVESGSYSWGNDMLPATGTPLSITMGGTDYMGSEGTITLTSSGAVGEKMAGTFSGIIRSKSGDSIRVRNGKFSATRQADRITQDRNVLEITGEGRSKFMVNMGDGGGNIGWVYTKERYISLVASISSTMISPDTEGSATLSIEYPDVMTGTRLWGSAHSSIIVRLGEDTYTGTSGATTLARLGPGLLGEISGTLSGTLTNTETKAQLKVYGRFFARRGN